MEQLLRDLTPLQCIQVMITRQGSLPESPICLLHLTPVSSRSSVQTRSENIPARFSVKQAYFQHFKMVSHTPSHRAFAKICSPGHPPNMAAMKCISIFCCTHYLQNSDLIPLPSSVAPKGHAWTDVQPYSCGCCCHLWTDTLTKLHSPHYILYCYNSITMRGNCPRLLRTASPIPRCTNHLQIGKWMLLP